MSAPGPIRKYTAGFTVIAMLGSSAASAAPVTAPRVVDPLAVVSIFGTAESAAAICAGSVAATAAGNAATTTAGAAATAGQAPGAGCVLPVIDAPPLPVVEATPPEAIAPAVSTTGGIAAFPLLAGLAAIVGLAAVILGNRSDDGEIDLPISP